MKRSHDQLSDADSHHEASARPARQALPKISRKITACTECQTRKVKCNVGGDRVTCSRCERLGLKCIVNKSLQSLLSEESSWKSNMDQTTQSLLAAVSHILRTLNLPSIDTFVPTEATPLTPTDIKRDSRPPTDDRDVSLSMPLDLTRENSQEPADDVDATNLVAPPLHSLYEVTKLKNIRAGDLGAELRPQRDPSETDLIARGKVSLAEAEELFVVFNQSLNQYLWGYIALVHPDLASVRKSSSLLLAALLSVTALHVPGKESTFDVCYAELLRLVSESMLDRYHCLDGIRGLCIGAFWMSDVSWKLSGHAVRIATELNLHQSFSRAMRGQVEHVDRARLWYLLYVCDHHFSIAYGRPPVIHEDEAISGHESFLRLPGIMQSDVRLHTQISMFIILHRIYNVFGADNEREIREDQVGMFDQFNDDLDNWRATWSRQLVPNPYVSSYPMKGLTLHYHFGKLLLNGLALRGIGLASALSAQRQRCGNLSITSAMEILRFVLSEQELRDSLVGIPLYLHTMISYAAVFLLKLLLKERHEQLRIDVPQIIDLETRIVELLSELRVSKRHLCFHIAAGLRKMLDRVRRGQEMEFLSPLDDLGVEFDLGLYGEHFPVGFFDVLSSHMPG